VKVTRETGASRDDKPNYALQLSASRYFTEDYDTVETPALKQAPARSNVASTQKGLNTVLNQLGYGNLFNFKV
jgi:hypothetical protein